MKKLPAFAAFMLLMTLICFTAFFDFSFADIVPSITPPTMDVWFDGGPGNTYIYFFNMVPGEHYRVTLFEADAVTVRSGPHPWELATMPPGEEPELMPFDDFDVNIEPGNIVQIEHAPNDIPSGLYTAYQVADISVDEVNVNTEVITGSSNGNIAIDVIVFTDENHTVSNTRRVDVIGGTWSADFSTDGPDLNNGSENTAIDIDSSSTGLIIQPDGLGNNTITNWWAPNPEFKVDPMTDTVGGWGWLGEVTVVLNYGTSDALFYYITPDETDGSFDQVSLGGMNLYPGQLIHVFDYMTIRDIVVGSITVESINFAQDLVNLTSTPYTYVQICILEGSSPETMQLFFREGFTDENGNFIADYSIDTLPDGSPAYDISYDTFGFVRQYGNNGDTTMYEWHASDYLILGDVDGNGVIDKNDIKALVAYISGRVVFTPEQLIAADFNEDGAVDALDIRAIQKSLHK